ncbi:MAG TPA: hypothetical protein VKV19_02875 [Ktedonobacteraceae bacterium]|nr:hypothetical protein [Ktedonobacteraceae bacterium]
MLCVLPPVSAGGSLAWVRRCLNTRADSPPHPREAQALPLCLTGTGHSAGLREAATHARLLT